MKGIFGDMFDFNKDGQMDCFERAAEFQFLESLIESEKTDNTMTELELSGLDPEELEFYAMTPEDAYSLLECIAKLSGTEERLKKWPLRDTKFLMNKQQQKWQRKQKEVHLDLVNMISR